MKCNPYRGAFDYKFEEQIELRSKYLYTVHEEELYQGLSMNIQKAAARHSAAVADVTMLWR
jgi:hypothetical protein